MNHLRRVRYKRSACLRPISPALQNQLLNTRIARVLLTAASSLRGSLPQQLFTKHFSEVQVKNFPLQMMLMIVVDNSSARWSAAVAFAERSPSSASHALISVFIIGHDNGVIITFTVYIHLLLLACTLLASSCSYINLYKSFSSYKAVALH